MIDWIVSSSVLIAVILILRQILKGKIGLRLQYALWALVLVRLLLPVSIGSSALSILNPLERSEFYQSHAALDSGAAAPLSPTIRPDAQDPPAQNAVTPTEPSSPLPQTPAAVETPASERSVSAQTVLKGVWFSGSAALGFWFLFTDLRFAARLRKNRISLSIDCKLPVYVSDTVDTPCLFGLFRPTIYLTAEAAADERTMRHAIQHELTHRRHGDHIWSILRCVCLALHWYNPLVWCAAALSRSDAELACDEDTIRRLGESERAEYGKTLLRLTCQKRPRLLSTATTMAASSKAIQERISLIVRKPKTALITLFAVIAIALIAVGCTFTGAKDQNNDTDLTDASPNTGENDRNDDPELPDTTTGGEEQDTANQPNAELSAGVYPSMEAYVRQLMAQITTVSYLSVSTNDTASAKVLDTKLAWLENVGSLEGLAPDGVLEVWKYSYLTQIDAAAEDVMLVGGQREEDGYYDLEGRGGRLAIALRDAAGSYSILHDATFIDGMDFFSYRSTIEEGIYDWYVTEYDLDLPLYVEDWISLFTMSEEGQLGNYPVNRFDGNGFYLYIPTFGWESVEVFGEFAGEQWQWRSTYNTDSTLTVDYFGFSADSRFDDHRLQGFTQLDEDGLIWTKNDGGITTYYYCFITPGGSFWRVTIRWTDARITSYPYIAIEPQILHLMATSFVAVSSATGQSADPLTRLKTLMPEDVLFSDFLEREDMSRFTSLLAHAIESRIDYSGELNAFWNFNVYLAERGGVYSTADEYFSVRAGLEENLVQIFYHNGSSNYTTLYLEDESLYQFTRTIYESEPIMDEAALALFDRILSARAQQVVDASGEYTDYPLPYTGFEILSFHKVADFSEDGAAYEIYEWDCAFLTDDPMKVGWAGGMWLDSKLRVRAVEQYTYFVVCTRGDMVEHDFFFWDLYLGPDEATGQANAYAAIVKHFSTAE